MRFTDTNEMTPGEYMPQDPMRALCRVWEGWDLSTLICGELNHWFSIAENDVSRGKKLVNRREFIGLYTGLLPLIDASYNIYLGALMHGQTDGDVNPWCLFLTPDEMEDPMSVLRRFVGRNDLETGKMILSKWFQVVEGDEGPYREKLKIPPAMIYETVMGILEAAYGLVQKFPEPVWPVGLLRAGGN